MGAGGSTSGAQYETDATTVEEQKAELMAQARRNRDAPVTKKLNDSATAARPQLVEKEDDVGDKNATFAPAIGAAPSSPPVHYPMVTAAQEHDREQQHHQLSTTTTLPPPTATAATATVTTRDQQQGQTLSSSQVPTRTEYPPANQFPRRSQSTVTATSTATSTTTINKKPTIIPQRGQEADSFFKNMIQKYYSIKTETAIDDIVHQPRQRGVNNTATKEQHYISRDGASSVHWACYNGDVAALESLLHQQKDDEVRDMVGRTALFYAACRGHIDCCALLMDHHDDWIDIGDRKGDTPLHVAAFYRHTGVVRLLLQSAADVNARNKHGYAPLHVALDEVVV